MGWSRDELVLLAGIRELSVSAGRAPVPVWVVVVDERVFVRTWHPRDTGWYGGARRTRRLTVEVGGSSVETDVVAVGATDAEAVDTAYVAKYGASGAASMVTADAVSSTLLLVARP